MKNKGSVKFSVFLFIIFLLEGSYALYTKTNIFQLRFGRPVAKLSGKTGEVQFHSEENPLWKKLDRHQFLYDGDSIATRKKSGAEILFFTGRTVLLTQNSVIKVKSNISKKNKSSPLYYATTIEETFVQNLKGTIVEKNPWVKKNILRRKPDKRGFTITLEKGSLIAKTIPKKKGRISERKNRFTIKSGNLRFEVATGKNDQIGIYKPESRSPQLFVQVKKGRTLVKRIDPNTIPEKPKPVISAKPGAETTQKIAKQNSPLGPPPEVKLKAKGYEPKIIAPQNNSVAWTPLLFNDLKSSGLSWPIEVMPPENVDLKDKNQNLIWKPLLQVSPMSELYKSRPFMVDGVESFSQQKIGLPLSKIVAMGPVIQKQGFFELRFLVNEGVLLRNEDMTGKSFVTVPKQYVLRSLADVGKDPLILEFSDLNPDQDNPAVIIKKTDHVATNSSIIVDLVDTRDVKRLYPAIVGSAQFSLRTGRFPNSNNGIFVVRNESIIAQIRGEGKSRDNIVKIRQLLVGDLVFEGEISSYLVAKGKSSKDLQELIIGMLTTGKNLFFLNKDSLVEVNKHFFAQDDVAADFVAQYSQVIFLKEVKIIDTKQRNAVH